jgi:hypothetical protein
MRPRSGGLQEEKGNIMTTENPIKPLLQVLASTLDDAARYAMAASVAMKTDQQNQAIGTLLSIEELLPTAQALYKAALALHRAPRKGGAQ